MKRSEMLKKIEELYSKLIILNKLQPISAHDAALNILTLIERAGMEPPKIQTDIYIRSECDFAYSNEWDPEDNE